jgi:hypothetical protein
VPPVGHAPAGDEPAVIPYAPLPEQTGPPSCDVAGQHVSRGAARVSCAPWGTFDSEGAYDLSLFCCRRTFPAWLPGARVRGQKLSLTRHRNIGIGSSGMVTAFWNGRCSTVAHISGFERYTSDMEIIEPDGEGSCAPLNLRWPCPELTQRRALAGFSADLAIGSGAWAARFRAAGIGQAAL